MILSATCISAHEPHLTHFGTDTNNHTIHMYMYTPTAHTQCILTASPRLHAAATDVWRGCCALAPLLSTELAAAAAAEISRQAAEEAVSRE